MKDDKKLAPQTVTVEQREWIDKEVERTCESIGAVIRRLIQDKIKKGK